MGGNALTSVCLSVCQSVSTLSFESTDLGLDLLHVCGTLPWLMGLKLKVIG